MVDQKREKTSLCNASSKYIYSVQETFGIYQFIQFTLSIISTLNNNSKNSIPKHGSEIKALMEFCSYLHGGERKGILGKQFLLFLNVSKEALQLIWKEFYFFFQTTCDPMFSCKSCRQPCTFWLVNNRMHTACTL